MNAYKRWIAATVCGSVRGRCGGWTRRMQRTFPELRLVGGFVARADMPPWAGTHLVHAHWWLVTAAGQVVDPTARQFGWPLVYIEIGDAAAFLDKSLAVKETFSNLSFKATVLAGPHTLKRVVALRLPNANHRPR